MSGDKLSFFTAKNTGVTANTDYKQLTGSVAITNNIFHFVVATWDGSNIRIYVDGKSDGVVAWANAPVYQATNYVRIGCQNNTGTNINFFTGSLDDLFLLNGTALTSDEIYSLYKTGVKKLNGQVNLNPELESTS